MKIRLTLGALTFAALTNCNGVPIARTVNDIAKDLCAIFFAEKQGISVEDAARTVCSTREVLDPFIREVLKAQQAAGAPAPDAGPSCEPEEQPKSETVIIVVRDMDAGAKGASDAAHE